MSNMNCPQCGAPLAANEGECKYCGEKIQVQQPVYQQPSPQHQVPYQQQPYQQPQQNIYIQQPMNNGINPSWPIKNKVTAGVLGILLGGLGVHKFYMGKVGLGIVYLLFCWTYIPAFIGFIEGIIYLTSNDHNFQIKNKVRLQ